MRRALRRRYGRAAGRAAGRKLSGAQIEALYAFAQAGGHGFGEFSGISVPTAKALYRLGYIRVGSADTGKKGVVTPEGLAAIAAVTIAPKPENSSLVHKPYGWSEWPRWSDAERRSP